MVSYLLQPLPALANGFSVSNHKRKPFAWDKVASRLPSVAFLNKNGGGRSSLSSTVSRRGEQSNQGTSVTAQVPTVQASQFP